MNCPEVTNTELCPMNRDLSAEKDKVNPPGSTRISDGRNLLGPGESPRDKEFGPDFIVAVKVESEFPDEYSSLGKDLIVKVKVESEFEDDPMSQEKAEAEVVKSETFQNNLLQTSQDALSNNHVKQELCDSPPTEPSKAVQLIEAFKSNYLRRTFAMAISATEDDEKTLKEFWKEYNMYHCIKNITWAWDDVTMQCMNGVWKKSPKEICERFQGF
uniref:uncharacterized protein n=1 Tax=Myxine glutinosa TaxID=7769 RepID=UPI00358F9194